MGLEMKDVQLLILDFFTSSNSCIHTRHFTIVQYFISFFFQVTLIREERSYSAVEEEA